MPPPRNTHTRGASNSVVGVEEIWILAIKRVQVSLGNGYTSAGNLDRHQDVLAGNFDCGGRH